MGDKKKRKEKEKEKKKEKDKKKDRDQKKKKRDRSLSESSSSDSSSSSSESSPSVDRRKKKQKKIKKKDKKVKKQTPQKETPAPSNFPYDFNSVPATLPGLKSMSIPAIPPPMPVVSTAAPVPKSRSKQPNIFKLLPKLPYGAVLFAKTIYSGDYLSEGVADKVLIEMTRVLQKTTKQEQHKKGSSIIAKCIGDLNKVFLEEKEQKLKATIGSEIEMAKQKSNRYENLQRVYKQSLLREVIE